MSQVILLAAQAAGFVSLMGSIEKGAGNTLNLPEGMINIGGNGKGYLLEKVTGFNPVTAENRDESFTVLAIGDDIYIYAVQAEGGIAKWIASKNATYPTGETAETSRKVGGFHFGKTRTVAKKYDKTYTCPTEIISNSCWDLKHRPTCDPTGMVEVLKGQLWADIYLSSAGTGADMEMVPVSKYNAVPVTGIEGYSYNDFHRVMGSAGKRAPNYWEFLALSYGIPQGAAGGSNRINTGLSTGYGFDPVSVKNVSQPAGNIYQVGRELFDMVSGGLWTAIPKIGKENSFNKGDYHGTQNTRSTLFGGEWSNVTRAGSDTVNFSNSPWVVADATGFRGVCDSL